MYTWRQLLIAAEKIADVHTVQVDESLAITLRSDGNVPVLPYHPGFIVLRTPLLQKGHRAHRKAWACLGGMLTEKTATANGIPYDRMCKGKPLHRGDAAQVLHVANIKGFADVLHLLCKARCASICSLQGHRTTHP